MSAVLTLAEKVGMILVLIIVGFAVAKLKWLTEKGAKEMSSILIKIIAPCLSIDAMLNAPELKITDMLLAVGSALVAIFIGMGVVYLFFKKEPPTRQKVLRFAGIFSNAGFVGIPLAKAIVGDIGVVYASFFVVGFCLVAWTYGYSMMCGGENRSARKMLTKALINPGMIGIVISLGLYFCHVQLPSVLSEPIKMLADVNTPLAMMVIGSYVAAVPFREMFHDAGMFKAIAIRLIVAPGLYLLFLMLLSKLLPVSNEIFITTLIQAAAPVAANTAFFAVEGGQDSKLASKTVAISSLLCVITIPIYVLLAQAFLGVI